MSRSWQAHALHILDAIARLGRIVERGDLAADEVLYDAALRNLQTLAESTQRLPEALKQARPHIPWADIAGFRNILVHNYLGVIDPVTVRGVIDNDIEPLAAAVRDMLEAAAGVDSA